MTIMGDKTKDDKWVGLDADIKILTLEHMMAARRLGFDAFFALFHKVKKYQMSFLQGTVSEIEFFTKVVLPIAESMNGNGHVALEILKEHSPLLSKQNKEKPYESY